MITFREFVVKHFLGLNGVKLSTLDKNGHFKPARTISWLKAGSKIFLVFILYGIEKILVGGVFNFWDIPFLLLILACIYLGFIYPRMYPKKDDELNDVEKKNY